MQVKTLLFFSSLVFLFLGRTRLQSEDEIPTEEPTWAEYTKEGEPERRFSFLPPPKWKVTTEHLGYEVFMEPKEKIKPTKEMPLVANPNLTIKVLLEPIPIDETSLKHYQTQIEKNLTENLGEGSGVNVFQSTLFPIDDTRQALVYDVSFLRGDKEIYQTIVVTSDSRRLFRATLTDFKVFFMENREKIFPYMVSIDYDGPSPVRPTLLEKYGLMVAILLGSTLALLALFFKRHQDQKRLFQESDSSDPSEDFPSESKDTFKNEGEVFREDTTLAEESFASEDDFGQEEEPSEKSDKRPKKGGTDPEDNSFFS